jgi:hypothetical protein
MGCLHKRILQKPSDQCKNAAAKATKVLHQILQSFHYRDEKVYEGQYKKYVQPHLEFALPAWHQSVLGDISVVEKCRKGEKINQEQDRQESHGPWPGQKRS